METTATPITLDNRNRINLNGFNLTSSTYLVRQEDNGVLVLEPAVVLSAAELAYLKNPEVQQIVEKGLATQTEDLKPRKRRGQGDSGASAARA